MSLEPQLPDTPPGPPPPPVIELPSPARRWFFTTLFFLALVWQTQALWGPPVMKLAGPARAARPPGEGAAAVTVIYFGRFYIGLQALINSASMGDSARAAGEQQLKAVAEQLRRIGDEDPPPAGVKACLILYTHFGWPEAEGMRKRLEALPAPDEGESSRSDAALRKLYLDRRPLDSAELEQVNKRMRFLGELATLHSYRLNNDPRAAELEQGIQSGARRMAVFVTIGVGAVVMAAFVGIMLLTIFARNMITGIVASRMADSRVPPHLAFEAVAVYLGLMAVVPLMMPPTQGLGNLRGLLLLPVIFLAGAAYPMTREAVSGMRVKWSAVQRDLGLIPGAAILREALCGIAGYAAALPLIGIAALINIHIVQLTGLSEDSGMHPLVPMLVNDSSPMVRAGLFLLVVILVPMMEEIMFRGYFYRFLRSRYDMANSIFISAALFAGIHPQGMMGFFPLLALGMVFAALREWRGSIIAPMVAHACVNAVAMISATMLF